jgi:UDP-glucuronate decarboxylase
MTIKEMAEVVIKSTGSASRIVYKPLPVDDPQIRQPDITLAKQLLGWQPQVSLEEGLKHTIAWFRRQPGLAK